MRKQLAPISEVQAKLTELYPCTAKDLACACKCGYSTIKSRLSELRNLGMCHVRINALVSNGIHYGTQALWYPGAGTGKVARPAPKHGINANIRRRKGTWADIPKASNWGGYYEA